MFVITFAGQMGRRAEPPNVRTDQKEVSAFSCHSLNDLCRFSGRGFPGMLPAMVKFNMNSLPVLFARQEEQCFPAYNGLICAVSTF